MRHFFTFDEMKTGKKQKARGLGVTEFDDALGKATVYFSWLDAALNAVIVKLAEIDSEHYEGIDYDSEEDEGAFRHPAFVICNLLSFKNKLDAIGSLTASSEISMFFTEDGVVSEFLAICQKAEELRNQLQHSLFPIDDVGRQVKIMPRRNGLKIVNEHLPVGEVLDIACFMANTALCAEDFAEYVDHLVSEDKKAFVGENGFRFDGKDGDRVKKKKCGLGFRLA